MMYKIKIIFIWVLAASFGVITAKEIADGVRYELITSLNNGLPLRAHVIIADPVCVSMIAQRSAGSREEVSAIVARTGALAGINAGFFRRGGRFNGWPLWTLKIDGIVIADAQLPRGSIAWSEKTGRLLIGYTRLLWTLAVDDRLVQVDRVNQPRGSGEAVVYTPAFGTTTLTHAHGIEYAVSGGKIIAHGDKGNMAIPDDGFVYSLDGQCVQDTLLAGSRALLICSTMILENGTWSHSSEWDGADFMISGAGMLIHKGTVCPSEDIIAEISRGPAVVELADEISAPFHKKDIAQWLVMTRHPRTALGVRENGQWVLVVVEGRLPGVSEGVTLQELGAFMLTHGCVQAVNLGGGGDSTMVVDGTIMNNTSGPTSSGQVQLACAERPVSDAILIMSRETESQSIGYPV